MKALLIPSATLIPDEMRTQMGMLPACLFPLQNVTMLERICDWYSGTADAVYVVTGKAREKVREYAAVKKLDVRLVELDELHDLGYTVRRGMEAILAENTDVQRVYINFGDTLLSNRPENGGEDVIYYAREAISPDWTYFSYDGGLITQIWDKGQMAQARDGLENAFPGVFELVRPRDFLEELRAAAHAPQPGQDTFYAALKRYVNGGAGARFVLAEDWFDVGHRERYAQARTAVAARVFNTIGIDKDRGLLTKRSENRDKLIHEIKWYLKLPDALQYMLPRIYRYSLDWNEPYVTMEYYGYTTLHEMLVYGDVNEAQWRTIFSRLLFILRDMGRFKVTDRGADREKALREIYIDKTVDRLKALRDDEHFSSFFEGDIYINGEEYPSLDECIRMLPELLQRQLMTDPPDFCIIHGDLCFSNILVESDLGFMRVIDPRGSFGDYDIYGDPRYELAKLMHSMDGQYDHITEDLFSVEVEGNEITYSQPQSVSGVYRIFREVFQPLLADYADLRLIESLLFLSMIPLHRDHRDRQYAMLATGLQLLRKAEMGEDTDGR